MGSVQSEIECPNCKYDRAMSDYYYKSDEEYIFCEKCGYSYSRTALLDKAKGREIYNKAKKYLKDNKLNEAIVILKINGTTRWTTATGKDVDIINWNDEDKIKQIKDTIDRIKECKFKYYYKFNKDGGIEYDEKEIKGFGSYRIMFDGGGTTGNFINEEGIKQFEDRFKEKGYFENQKGEKADKISYTFKKDGEWFIKDLISNEVYSFVNKEVIDNLK